MTSLRSTFVQSQPIKWSAVYIVPYLLLIFCRIYNFGADSSESGADDGFMKMTIEGASYLFAGLLVIEKIHKIRHMFWLIFPYFLYALYAGITASWSGHPNSVFLRVGHMIGLGFVAICAGLWAQQRREAIFYLTAIFMLFVLVLSVLFVLLFPGHGVVTAGPGEPVSSGARWLGVTGHPNLLGAAAMAGIWAAVAIQYLGNGLATRALSWSTIVFGVVALIGSDSRTSLIATIFILFIFLLFQGRRAVTFGAFIQRLLSFFGIAAATIRLMYVVSPEFVISHLTPGTRIGAGSVLSDRNIIWQYGVEALYDYPMGWSFDLLQTYWDVHGREVLFPHFHNGFLDVAVKGGVVGESILLIILFRMMLSLKRLYKLDYKLFVIYFAFFSGNILYNFVETGFDRESVLWPILVVVWITVEEKVYASKGERQRTSIPLNSPVIESIDSPKGGT